jgi:hypothetical protein
LADAQSLQDGWSDRTGQFIITFHAIELGLKAYLISVGKTEKELERRPFGHDLVALYDAALAGGMVLNTPHARDLIEWINEWHCHDVKIRYLPKGRFQSAKRCSHWQGKSYPKPG